MNKKKLIRNVKKADLELDEIIKVILGVIFLIVLIGIIWYLKGEFFTQGTAVKDSFSIFK